MKTLSLYFIEIFQNVMEKSTFQLFFKWGGRNTVERTQGTVIDQVV